MPSWATVICILSLVGAFALAVMGLENEAGAAVLIAGAAGFCAAIVWWEGW